MKTVFIIDDHIAFRTGFRMMLGMIPGVMVIGEASSSAILIPETTFPAADVVFLDVHLKNINSFELTRNLHNLYPWMKIIILSMFSEPDYVTNGKQAGADAVVLKSVVSDALGTLLQELFPGEFIFDEKCSQLTGKNT